MSCYDESFHNWTPSAWRRTVTGAAGSAEIWVTEWTCSRCLMTPAHLRATRDQDAAVGPLTPTPRQEETK